MSKEIYISTTPHETRLAIVEDEQLAEIYFERENEYTLAGSIYNGKVTRVLPGMQSSFVDIGLERDAFLYVTDFMEEQGDAADFDSDGGSRRPASPVKDVTADATPAREGSRERGDRGRGRREDRSERRDVSHGNASPTAETESTTSFDEPIAPAPMKLAGGVETDEEGTGSRRWRGRRGRRRGRGLREDQPLMTGTGADVTESQAEGDAAEADLELGFVESLDASAATVETDLSIEPRASQAQPRGRDERGSRGRDRHNRERGPRREADRPAPAFDNSYAGYLNDDAQSEAGGEPVLLPGESIRKYRDPAIVAAEDEEARRNAPPLPETNLVAAPSIEITGWDGGAVLPGETLSRSRNRGQVHADNGRDGRTDRSRGIFDPGTVAKSPLAASSAESFQPPVVTPVASEGNFPEAVAPEEPTGLTELPAHSVYQDAVDVAATADLGALPGDMGTDSLVEHTLDAPEPLAGNEYEPEEGASVTVRDTSRRDLRRLEQPGEPAAVDAPTQKNAVDADGEMAFGLPDPTTYDLNAAAEEDTPEHHSTVEPVHIESPAVPEPGEPEFTNLHADGEMVSFAEPGVVEAEPSGLLSQQDLPVSADHMAGEGAYSPAGEDLPSAAEELFNVGSTQASKEPEIHAYGDGDFHEEELDEELDGDEYDYPAAMANAEDGEVEYEEETLDDTSDPGSVLHEMSQNGPEAEEDIDEREDTLPNAGGFTEADFGEDPGSDDEGDAQEETTGTVPSGGDQRPPRDSSRRHTAGGGRDRRGGRNTQDRGRSGRRQSMQTTDLPAINELLKPGQEILVQIAKEPIAKKGARITSHIALPGRFLVFMPTVNHTGVSRKISSDEERRRLKSVLLSEKGDAQGGFIVRTAADGASEEELRNDLRFLIQMWTDIKTRSESSKSPALIYHDLNLVERILRDQVTDNFSAIWVDTEQEYERVLRFLQRFQPSLVRRVKLYTKETPLFEHFGVTAEIDKALKSKVWLKSGGSIVINQTEALVAIDINTGKYVGKTARLEDTILKTNLDSIPEIVRQIRLRDLGGIIVIDFIDMDERKNRAKVMQALEDAMRTDRAPSKILPFNDFGLVIMTRKRVKQSLERTLCMPDPVTEGTGMIKSPITIANEIYVEMRKMHRHLEKTDVLLRVHPEVVKTLKANGGKRLQELEDMTRKTILVKSDPALSPEAFDIH